MNEYPLFCGVAATNLGLSINHQKRRGDRTDVFVNLHIKTFTLPETNIAPVRRPSQKETHLPTPVFQVLCQSQREGG